VIVLVVVLAFGLGLRLATLQNPLSFDEYVQLNAVQQANSAGLAQGPEMNPLTNWTRLVFVGIFGFSIETLRAASLLFAILSCVVLYWLAKELYGKVAAFWAVALLALSHLHALVSTSISFDGTFLTFYTFLTIYLYIRFARTKKVSYLCACGVAFGLAVLTKYPGVLVFFALLIYALLQALSSWHANKKYAEKGTTRGWSILWLRIWPLLIIGLVGIVVFAIFPLVVWASGSDWSYFWVTLGHGKSYFGGRTIDPLALFMQFALAAIWIGPALIFLYLLAIFNKDFKTGAFNRTNAQGSADLPEDWIIHLFIIIILLFYIVIVQDPFRPVERYFSILLPALALIAGGALATLEFKRKESLTALVTCVITLIACMAINLASDRLLPFYPKSGLLSEVLSLRWDFLVPFTGDQGPVGLYVAFGCIALAFVLSLVAFLIIISSRQSTRVKAMTALLLGVGIGFSLFFTVELAFHPTSPNIGAVASETAAAGRESGLPGPYYTFRDYALQYTLGRNATNIDFTSDPQQVHQELVKGATLVFVDFPAIDKQGLLWNSIMDACVVRDEFSSHGETLGYLMSCGSTPIRQQIY